MYTVVLCVCAYKLVNLMFIYIGYAGSDEKVAYLKEIGFDEAVNYKKIKSLSDSLQQTCPKGIDMFFDNVSNNSMLNS